MESEKKKENDKPTPILALFDDIPQINNIIISFWGKKARYNNQFYYKVLKTNFSYVYKIDKEIIAVCLVNCYKEQKEISIDLLCVKKAYQGNGLGKSLLDFCIKNCMKEGYYTFYLHVATTNNIAIKLYEKMGFNKIEYVPNYYFQDGPPNNNAYLMKLDTRVKKKYDKKDDNNNIKYAKENSNNIFSDNNYNKTNNRYFYNHYHYNNNHKHHRNLSSNFYENNNNNYYYNNYCQNCGDYHNDNYYDNHYYSNYRGDYWRHYNRWYHH